jgi:hypothetical protein
MDKPDSATEADLRKRLYELDSALDTARLEDDSVPKLAALAAARQEVLDQLDLLLRPGDMGYQANPDKRLDKIDTDPIPILTDGYPTR